MTQKTMLLKMIYPILKEILFENPWKIFTKFKDRDGSIFLDSAQTQAATGQYSFIGIDPFLIINFKDKQANLNNKIFTIDPFNLLLEKISEFPLGTTDATAPFQGGIAGLFSYELALYLEKLPIVRDDMQFPDMLVGFYDLIIGFDHHRKKAWIFSSGYPEKNETERKKRAKKRLAWILSLLEKKTTYSFSKSICHVNDIQSNFTAQSYQSAVIKTKEFILNGDIFQANISQRFITNLPPQLSPFDLYTRLRHFNPSPFAAYFHYQDTAIVSASPERFVKLNNGYVETRPIKGTRPRGNNTLTDNNLANELCHSSKDHAENIMIVDLMRNDISRVCENHSVIVTQLCQLESFPTVHHLVSVVQGKLKNNYHAIDLLQATFPGGSITGAPKIRAMEIIADIERIKRGPYCGSLGYIGFNGAMDTSILIRTFAIKQNSITFHAGGAIVLDSDPLNEYEETLAKAAVLKKSLTESI